MQMLDPLSLPSMNPQDQRHLPARFFYEAVENKAKSVAEGRPIYDEILFINILRPGDKTTDVIQEATPKHLREYAQEYKLFMERGEQATSGTPLEQLTFLNRKQIAEFKAMDVFNVESLAMLDDRFAFMGWRDLKNKAVAYLAMAKDQSVATRWAEAEAAAKVHAENQDAKIAALTEQVAQLIAKLNSGNSGLTVAGPDGDPPRRGPGRPRKEAAA